MSRHFSNWLDAFCDYASFGEAPRRMYFWTGVSTLAGALRRKVWIDQAYFKWFPNFYVVLVAPPGIVSKSTTAGIGMNLLRQVPGIRFGPDVVTWQALVGAFAEAAETFEHEGQIHTMSPVTIESSEFGNLLNPSDKDMVDLLVSLWDGKQGYFEKRTKMSGNDRVENPWINLIACTTPSWIAGNFPEYMIGGGFTSRCVFVYAEEKERYVAYPGLVVPRDLSETSSRLIQDLEHISVMLSGAYRLTPDAVLWGEQWYRAHYEGERAPDLDDDRFGGYIARKQTHIHKLAMIVAASQSDRMEITPEDLSLANSMVSDLEKDMPMVFSKIGRSEVSFQVERMINWVRKRKAVELKALHRHFHSTFPLWKEYEDVIQGLTNAGIFAVEQRGSAIYVVAR